MFHESFRLLPTSRSSFRFLLCTLTRSSSCGLQISVIFIVSKTYLYLELHGIVTESYRCNLQSNDIYYTPNIHLDNCGIVLTACLHGRKKLIVQLQENYCSYSVVFLFRFVIYSAAPTYRIHRVACISTINKSSLIFCLFLILRKWLSMDLNFGSENVQFSLHNQIYIISSVNLSFDLNLSPFFVVVKELLILLSLTFYLLSIDIGFSPY